VGTANLSSFIVLFIPNSTYTMIGILHLELVDLLMVFGFSQPKIIWSQLDYLIWWL